MIQTDLYSFSFRQGTLVPWCKSCGAQNFYKDGKNGQGKQLYRCKICGFRFVWNSDLPKKRFFSSVVSFAVEMYTGIIGISLRVLSRILNKLGFKVSHQAIRNWVLQYKKKHFIDEQADNAQTWHCDETYFKVKGIGYWLWVVYCKETKQVLSWHISDKHLLRHAKALLDEAKKRVGRRPEKVISDGLWQYNVAVYKTMGWHWTEHKKRYLADSGIGKNAVIERVNKEIKRRFKWFGTFQAMRGAKAFFNLFFDNFNKRTALAQNTG